MVVSGVPYENHNEHVKNIAEISLKIRSVNNYYLINKIIKLFLVGFKL